MLEIRRQYFREVIKNKQSKNVKEADDEVETDNNQVDKINFEREKIKRQADFSTFFSDCMNRMENNKGNHIEEPSKKEVIEAIDDTENKIREQKIALKKKIETARKNAYSTRKPEKIQETEKIIKEILDKYGLTEEMLDEV